MSGRCSPTHSYTAKSAAMNQGGQGHCVCVRAFLFYLFSFLSPAALLSPIRLHRSGRRNNTQTAANCGGAEGQNPAKIALTEPEGKAVILRSPSDTPTLLPHGCTEVRACVCIEGLGGGGVILPGLPPCYDESPALRRPARPTSICGRLDPLIRMPVIPPTTP